MAGQSQRTCLYFGTFNPIHSGHLMIAQATLRQYGSQSDQGLGFETVTFIPAGSPPHRHHEDDLLDARRRLKMVQLATADHPAFRVLDIETHRPGHCYTVDTVQALIEQGKVSVPVPFIIGADALRGLASWHQPQLLVDMVHFLQAPRPDCEPVNSVHLQGQDALHLKTSAIEMPTLAISSTGIRQTLKGNAQGVEGLRYFLPEPVRTFIRDNSLYR
jgi:nicotinate-nucleotide adenylyltransferase